MKKSTSDSVSIDLINKNSGQKKRKISSSSSSSSNADSQQPPSSSALAKKTKPESSSSSSSKIDPNKPKLVKSKTTNPDTPVNKLKSSQSSTDLAENKIKKVPSSESTSTTTPNNKLISKKEILGANNSLNKSSNKNSNSLNKSLPTSSAGKVKPVATTTPTGNSKPSSSIMSQKTKLNEDIKTKVMKDVNKSRHSSFSGSANNSRLNLSAAEIMLKQQNSPLNSQNSLSNISIESGASSTIKQIGSNRTQSPSPLSLSMSSSLNNTTQSPQQGTESDDVSLPKYEPSIKSKKPASLSSQPPNLTNKPLSAPLQPTAQTASTKTQSQTPPLLTSLGLLGTKSSLSNFKIPHKPKKTEETTSQKAAVSTESDNPTPLSSSSPIVATTRSDSPNKDKANRLNQQQPLNRPGSANSNKTKPSISTSNNGRLGNGSSSNGSGSSPKWQGKQSYSSSCSLLILSLK